MSKPQNSENLEYSPRLSNSLTDAKAELTATSINLWLPGPGPGAGSAGFGENVRQKIRMG